MAESAVEGKENLMNTKVTIAGVNLKQSGDDGGPGLSGPGWSNNAILWI